MFSLLHKVNQNLSKIEQIKKFFTINEKFTSMKSVERHVENASKNEYFGKFVEILGAYGKAISLGGDIYHSIR